ncbi:SusC/RagA family TonB-linked outer membrane protein [Pedobacter frigoris]|uniref:SusC/RagA family TonB-linked outer membrane protein n=1 Tax=Pedobacter frigoris TaxID=2571272 RepID=UPI00292E141D|nr:SusC/RagA family TonB-linked outer membrane protein [Pedobacter frigoris]
MKLVTVLLIATIMQVSASGLAQNLTFKQKSASLERVFKEIRKQTGYTVFWPSNTMKIKTMDVDFRNTPISSVIEQCLDGQSLSYTIENKTIVIKEKEKSFLDRLIDALKAIDISGKVLDETGKPLIGATVSIVKVDGNMENFDAAKAKDFSVTYKGRSAAAITNADGDFFIKNVDEGSVVIVSYTGYRVFSAKAVKDMGTIRMVINSADLEEVGITVNTGYQSISRERSAGSIAKPDMNIFKNRSGSMDPIQRLEGLIPGLTINNAPGATKVLVRGLTSISIARSPLYVVNGIPTTDVSSVNPNDIEDITVLKDATSASIWGAKAANGVIIIVTKKGTNNNEIKINYDGFINFQGKPDLAYQNMMNSSQYIQTVTEIFNDPSYSWKTLYPYATISKPQIGGTAPVSPHETILYNQANLSAAQVNAALDQLASQNNLDEIKDLWYRNASLMNHSLSVAGGGNKYGFYGSVNYVKTQNSTPNTKNDNYSVNLRQDFKFSDRIKMYLITDLQNITGSSKNMAQPDATFLPYAMFKNTDGSNADMSWLYRTEDVRTAYEAKSLISLKYNPLDEINTGSSKNNLFRGRVTSGITVNLFDGLRYEGVFGIARGQNKSTNLLAQNNYSVRSELTSFTIPAASASVRPTYLLPENGGRNTVNNSLDKSWTVRNQLVYDQSWSGQKHQLTVLAGQEAQEQFTSSVRSIVRGYNGQLLSYGVIDYAALGKGVANTVMPNGTNTSSLSADFYSESESMARITSYYANGGYTYNGKYTINGGIRIDESNLFGKDKSAQNRPVWSTGVAWQIGREDFMKNLTWLDKLVLRTSYGITGNSPEVGTAASRDILLAATNSYYPGGAGLSLTTPANRALTWETTKTLNVGVDFNLFKNRLSGTVDVYHKNTENLIGAMILNPFTGFPTITGNAGDMTNRGVDLNISSVNLEEGILKWNTMLTMGYNKNKITHLNRTTPITLGSDKISQNYLEGYAAFSIFAYNYAGLDNMGNPQIKLTDGSIVKARNSAKPDDVKYMGSFQPKWSGGLSNMFGYKDFSLNVNVVYNLGYVLRRDVSPSASYSTRDRLFANTGFNGNLNAEFANRWKKPGDEAFTNIPSYIASSAASLAGRDVDYYRYADVNVVDASYIKLRDVTLSYSLPKTILGRLKADAVTFRAQLSNVMLWKANDVGIDPEFQAGSGGTRNPLSNQHTFTLGAHITF